MSAVVLDPCGARADPRMPLLARALDPDEVERHLGAARLALRAIRTVRYKPGRRCLIEYDLEAAPNEIVTLVAKARSRGADAATFHLLQALRARGFDEASPDGVAVPEPVAVIPALGVWLQRKVRGTAATAALAEPGGGAALAARLADALHKLHHAGVAARRRHTMADELRILHRCLEPLAERRPEWAQRLGRLLAACDRLGATTPARPLRGIHRDFYPDHALLDGERLYLLDFDLYCLGDPALDVGNCVAHITEQSVRTRGDPDALADREMALEERFVELAGEPARPAVRAYALLTLARHVYLSTQLADRRAFTAALLDLCEHRLGRALSQRAGAAGRVAS
ncbi:MAG TPA: phosphotransferase [Gemmatimonadales bacterium]|jgi:aminoglycoside phosphotransferase (APT) family kinase protein|nr:phosphotransferase [Gemmatimonadales bacterium]